MRGEAASAVVAVQAVVRGDRARGREIVGVEEVPLCLLLLQEPHTGAVQIINLIRHDWLAAA